MRKLTFIVFLVVLLSSCGDNSTIVNTDQDYKVFELVSSSESGITFNNKIVEDLRTNYLRYDGVYQGAGVAVGDINNDGLDDIFFTGNMVSDKLYLNKGDLKFEDVTKKAGVSGGEHWSTGVTIADVNNDGWNDIYVCKFLYHEKPEMRENLLYINNGDLTFTERAKEFGVADTGYSIQSTFLDYDLDGDLDLYICNQPPNYQPHKRKLDGFINYKFTDNLYRNDGSKFTKVTEESGVKNYCYSLSATVGDMNKDGFPDIYVASDYGEPDNFYQNNGDGTFTNIVHDAIRHMSNFSMGADIADINNDGWLDIYTADMVAADNYRLKTNMSGMNPKKFWELANHGYHYQYMFNALQLNNGNGLYSEIAQLSGIESTDWSWNTLLADLNNDGFKDLMVTNGQLRDVRNNDFTIKREKFIRERMEQAKAQGIANYQFNPLEIMQLAPSVKLSNFVYQNEGDLTFENKVTDWGMDQKTWSHGAAYADFDNDGDLDIVMNNMNENAFLYKNTTTENRAGNYLRIVPSSKKDLGLKAIIKYEDHEQYAELQNTRGYMSGSETAIHFGVGSTGSIDELQIIWPNGQSQVISDVEVNQEFIADKNNAGSKASFEKPETLFTKLESSLFKHKENEHEDYKDEILLPYRLSRLGPEMVSGDVNGDGLKDVFICGPKGQSSSLLIQNNGGGFDQKPVSDFVKDKGSEDVNAIFIDIEMDGDKDLYVVAGGNDVPENSPLLNDRLYINDGTGSFKRDASFPKVSNSGYGIAAGDFDGDGDQDLFVGGRQVPNRYGAIPESYLLKNENGKFIDVTDEAGLELKNVGMVTDADFLDLNKDGKLELVIAGEWMPVSVFSYLNNNFINTTEQAGLKESNGWWNDIHAVDIDQDGDLDLIAGNLGLNIKYKATKDKPFKAFIKDFDGNGTNDVYLGYYDEDGKCYPVRGRQCSSDQMPFVKEQFKTYSEFGSATIDQVLGERVEGANYLEAKMFESCILRNDGSGTFSIQNLPIEAQIAPIHGIISHDWNKDGFMDLLIAGNFYEREVETTRSDAGVGTILLGDADGKLNWLHPSKTGLLAYHDVRDAELIVNSKNENLIFIANNNGDLELYKQNDVMK